ncbi:MAG: hypothetical protein IE933_01095 [Sphingomonadales bacterium]|nr:hypothetical protein [Sphingomonadales bacterium]MBD3772680.1 hypothetical protein [Paracoccaceae bacterium]
MRSIEAIESWIEDWSLREGAADGAAAPMAFLLAGEEILEHWLLAHGQQPTADKKEGFRLLALHRQAAKGDPAFNACRETCREACYRYNLAQTDLPREEWQANLATLRRVVQHLAYFIGGKMRNAQLGEFCCSSRPIRNEAAEAAMEGEGTQ